jgi:hypothetical protein
MKSSLFSLVLALWVGGIVLFTFIVTPVIFKSFSRDVAGEIVGKLFPGYFTYNLVLSVLAIALFFLLTADRSLFVWRLSVLLLAAALVVNLFIVFKLHPDITAVKREISSFQQESPDSPMRKKFRVLHGVSAALNLFLLADGIILLVAGPFLKKA